MANGGEELEKKRSVGANGERDAGARGVDSFRRRGLAITGNELKLLNL